MPKCIRDVPWLNKLEKNSGYNATIAVLSHHEYRRAEAAYWADQKGK